MKLSPKQRAAIYGMFDRHCAYCGVVLPEKGWHADHIQAKYREGPDDYVNFYPACSSCNRFKATYSIEEWREQIELQVERARRYSFNFRFAEKFGLVAQVNTTVVFYFETFGAPR